MIRREFKINLKSFIIWTSCLIIMFLIVFLVYPYIVTDDSIRNLDEMMKIFPRDLLKAFNMDIASISNAYGWLKSEGLMFVLIVVGLYASIMGSNIVLKEEKDKTIEYLGSIPITRNKIMTNKIIVAISYILLMIIVLGLFNYISLLLSCTFDHTQYLLLSISPVFIALPLFSINLFISTLLHKTKGTVGIGMGMVFIFYIISVISELSDKVEVLRYFSIYTLADTRGILTDTKINIICVIVSIVISVVFAYLSYVKYNGKELL